MKKYFSIFAFAVMALVCLSSCGNDDDTPSTPPYTGVATRTGGVSVKWVQLWKDGPKFAEYNVGAANNKAEDHGGLYCWGGNIDKDPEKQYNKGNHNLSANDDTVIKLWGNNWRMPTKDELQALLDNCNVKRIAVNDVNGHIFTGKGDYSANSIFLPDAGRSYGTDIYGQNVYGEYWSSTCYSNGDGYYLIIQSTAGRVDWTMGNPGKSVRAVLAE